MSLSLILHFIEPGGICNDAVPLNAVLTTRAVTRRPPELSVRVMMQPCFETTPVPVTGLPPQQKRYSPVVELNTSLFPGFVSSWRQTSNVLTEKLHVAVLPAPSVAVHVTVVPPTGKHEPEGGVHTTFTPGQLSEAVVVKLTVAQPPDDAQSVCDVTAVTLAGHVIAGGCVSFTVTVKEQLGPLVVQVTVVVPTGKNDPDAGLHVTVPHVPVVVGAG
jgi:hypothetical protein